jgi:hypothetical protein
MMTIAAITAIAASSSEPLGKVMNVTFGRFAARHFPVLAHSLVTIAKVKTLSHPRRRTPSNYCGLKGFGAFWIMPRAVAPNTREGKDVRAGMILR